MSTWKQARPADLTTEQKTLLDEVRDALGDLNHDRREDGPVLVGAGTDGHVRLILGATAADDARSEAEIADLAARRLAGAGLRLTVDPERLAEGYYVRVARRTGRPEVGRMVQVRLPDELLARVDARAAEAETSRAEAIRQLVAAGLGDPADR